MSHQHNLEYINSVFERIVGNLGRDVTVYHIGGNAMCWHGLKNTTKDADLVILDWKEIKAFKRALIASGFIEEIIVGSEYKWIQPYGIFDEVKGTPLSEPFKPGIRVDLFLKQICGGFKFSEGMKKRAKEGGVRGKLTEYYCSPEDIFLFKLITERERDLVDMFRIYGSKPDFDVVIAELTFQLAAVDKSVRESFVESIKRSLDSLGGRYGVSLELL